MSYKLNERQTYSGKALKANSNDSDKFLLAGFMACCVLVCFLAWSLV